MADARSRAGGGKTGTVGGGSGTAGSGMPSDGGRKLRRGGRTPGTAQPCERAHGRHADAAGAIRRSGDPAIRRSGDPAIRRLYQEPHLPLSTPDFRSRSRQPQSPPTPVASNPWSTPPDFNKQTPDAGPPGRARTIRFNASTSFAGEWQIRLRIPARLRHPTSSHGGLRRRAIAYRRPHSERPGKRIAVETPRFTGALYKASGWTHVGTTQGRGAADPHRVREHERRCR